MTTSEEKYFIAKDLFKRIGDNFYAIENTEASDDLIKETIDLAEEVLEIVDKINLKVLKRHHPNNIYTITKNVNKVKEQGDYVLIALKKMKSYNSHKITGEQRHHLPPEMYDEDAKKHLENERNKQREEAKNSRNWNEKPEEFDIMGEGFISFIEYKKIKDRHEL